MSLGQSDLLHEKLNWQIMYHTEGLETRLVRLILVQSDIL